MIAIININYLAIQVW